MEDCYSNAQRTKLIGGITKEYPTNLFIGTGGEGFGIGSTPPGAQYPFGLVRLSPDTSTFDNVALDDWHFGGYYYNDDEIRCFSHTHMMGAGVIDYGNIGVMATSQLDSNTVKNNGYRSKFSHKNETAVPGYYSVYLETPGVFAELTVAGVYTGIHQYSYHEGGDKKYLLIDVTHSAHEKSVVNASVSIDNVSPSFSASGWALLKGSLTERNGVGVKVYFSVKVVGEVVRSGVWEDGVLHANEKSASGLHCGAYAEMSPTSKSVVVVISLSLISVSQWYLFAWCVFLLALRFLVIMLVLMELLSANENMKHDWNGTDFHGVASSTKKTWNEVLAQVEIDRNNSDTTSKFYTALYHVMSAPTQFSEAGGYYMGVDNTVHRVPDGTSDLSLWDIHRTQAPLLTLLRPDVASGITHSLLYMYEQGGALPRWPIANVYGSSMIGNHGYQIILGNVLKNPLLKVNLTEVYAAMKDEANSTDLPHDSRPCLRNYTALGYCPKEEEGNSASLTLAYAYDDWVVGVVASMLNLTEDAAYFLNRSENYRNIWDSERKLMCPRSISGQYHCPDDPLLNSWILKDDGYTEGNAEQWRWFVPHNIPGLIQLFGSNSTFVDQLDIFFEKAKRKSNLLPNEYYWAGNEPDLLAVYLFNFAGKPSLTQKHVRWLMENKYTSQEDGLPGNDDYGTLSAWYVWSALGLYPLSGTEKYFLGSPAIAEATVHLPNGTVLSITAVNQTAENVYANKIEFNGKTLSRNYPFLQHSDISNGGSLIFWMSSSP